MPELENAFPYKDIRDSVNAIWPGTFDEIHRITKLPPDTEKAILSELLAWACTPSYVPSIVYAREQIQKVNADWLTTQLPSVAIGRLDLNDEWEYRRLLEAVEHIPQLLHWAVVLGADSENLEIMEASSDYAAKL